MYQSTLYTHLNYLLYVPRNILETIPLQTLTQSFFQRVVVGFRLHNSRKQIRQNSLKQRYIRREKLQQHL